MDSRDSNLPKPPRCTKKWKGKEKTDAPTKKWKGKEKMDTCTKKWKGKEKMDAYIPQDDHQNQDNQVQPPTPRQLLSNVTSDETQKRIIAEFFYENNVSPYVVTSRSFRNLLDLGGKGALLQNCIPTVQELRGSIMYNEAHAIGVHVQEMKQLWQVNGCSIILDGWDDAQGRKLMNFLVDCPYGVVYLRSLEISPSFENFHKIITTFEDVFNEVGTDNVLQVISYTACEPWLEVAGNWIKERHRSMFWNICFTQCLSLILERVASSISWVTETIAQAKKITSLIYNNSSLLSFVARNNIQSDYGHVLVVPSKIRAATPFLTLDKMFSRKKDLQDIFCSQEWMHSHLGSSPKGIYVSTLVRDNLFWTNVMDIVKATIPIVTVLNLFNNSNNDNNSPQMGILYETMDQMKETIAEEIKTKARVDQFWTIIDDIWDTILHCPLHAAGLYLNPRVFYTDNFSADNEVIEGMLSTIFKIGGDLATQGIITEQLKLYQIGHGSFKQGIRERNKFPPIEWWMRFGSHCPELQTLAMKVLGLTCNGASSYQLRREVAENLLSISETHPSYEWLKNFAFVSYNVHLKQVKQPGFQFDMDGQDIDLLDDWFVDEH